MACPRDDEQCTLQLAAVVRYAYDVALCPNAARHYDGSASR